MTGPAQLVVQHPDGHETWHDWPRSLLIPRPGDHVRLDQAPDDPETALETEVIEIVHTLNEQAGQLLTYIYARPIDALPAPAQRFDLHDLGPDHAGFAHWNSTKQEHTYIRIPTQLWTRLGNPIRLTADIEPA